MRNKIAVITGSSKHFCCSSCGMKFDNFGDMQKDLTIEHHQKGDVP